MSRVFADGLGDQSLIPGQVIPKTQKMVLDAALLNIQQYKVMIKSSNPGNEVAPSLHLGEVAIEKGAFRSTSFKVANFIILEFTKHFSSTSHIIQLAPGTS